MTLTKTPPGAAAMAAHRESWLAGFAEACRARLESRGHKVPLFRVSCGFPTSKKAIGQCWPSAYSADQHYECFVSPTLGDALAAAKTCAHEVAHVADSCANGHGKEWKAIARLLGLDGKAAGGWWTDEGKAWAEAVIADLGPYPHAAMVPPTHRGGEVPKGPDGKTPKGGDIAPKQGTRMLKCFCVSEGCGYTVRTTRKWLDVALPKCPVHETTMQCPTPDDPPDGGDGGDGD